MDGIPKQEVKEDHFIFKIYSIAAQGLCKASLYYAEVSIEGDDQITKWTTPVDKVVCTNPEWHKQRIIMVDKINVHRELVHVVVKIFEKGALLDHYVGQVRVPVGETLDYKTETFPLLRSKFHFKKTNGAIRLACQVTPKLDQLDIAFPAQSMTAEPEEIEIVTAQHALPAAANVQQAAPPAATACSCMTAHNLFCQVEGYSQASPDTHSFSSYMPPGSLSWHVSYQQGAPGFWYPQQSPGYNYQPSYYGCRFLF